MRSIFDEFVRTQNVANFKRQLSTGTDERERETLLKLLTEELKALPEQRKSGD